MVMEQEPAFDSRLANYVVKLQWVDARAYPRTDGNLFWFRGTDEPLFCKFQVTGLLHGGKNPALSVDCVYPLDPLPGGMGYRTLVSLRRALVQGTSHLFYGEEPGPAALPEGGQLPAPGGAAVGPDHEHREEQAEDDLGERLPSGRRQDVQGHDARGNARHGAAGPPADEKRGNQGQRGQDRNDGHGDAQYRGDSLTPMEPEKDRPDVARDHGPHGGVGHPVGSP